MHPIGILDSGVGGLSVWKEIVRELPHESTVYIADSANIPYGTKSPEEIYQLTKKLGEFLLRKQVKIIVIACNTITVTCIDRLRSDFPHIPIIGTVPVVKTAAAVTKNKRIGILSTVRTSESEYQKELINKFALDCSVTIVGTDKLVPFVERGEIEGAEVEEVVGDVLQPFKQANVDAIAVACTHFPFLEPVMQKALGSDVQLLEPSAAIARHTKRILEHNGIVDASSSTPAYTFYTTGAEEQLEIVKKLLGKTFLEKLPQFHLDVVNA